MFVLNLVWAVIILFLTQDVICFIPQRQQIAIQPMSSGSVPFPLHDIAIGDSERAVYDPGEEILKTPTVAESDEYGDLANEVDVSDKILLKKLENDIREEQQIASKSAILMKFLEDPEMQTLPIVYVEEDQQPAELSQAFSSGMEKRSRYYRRYPWKRQNSRYRPYEADTRYLCVPSREDVFKLLVGLHENRNGNHQKTVSFCNRKRPAKAIFTNIRFLG